MSAKSPQNRLIEIASDQWGLVTRRQAERAGISPTTLDRFTAPGGRLERVGHGVYHLAGAPTPDHLGLRVAWLQLAPDVPSWEREADQGVVSHRSAAALYSIGHLAADQYEFTVGNRKQTRRADVRLHRRQLNKGEWVRFDGLPVTRPSRIASDLLSEHEDPEAVAQIIADSIRPVYDYPGTFADSLAPYAARFGFRRNDGFALLRFFLEMTRDPETQQWLEEARSHINRATANDDQPPAANRSRARVPSP